MLNQSARLFRSVTIATLLTFLPTFAGAWNFVKVLLGVRIRRPVLSPSIPPRRQMCGPLPRQREHPGAVCVYS